MEIKRNSLFSYVAITLCAVLCFILYRTYKYQVVLKSMISRVSGDRLHPLASETKTPKVIEKILEEIKEQCGENAPKEIKTATVYYKPKFASTVPDYHIHKTDKWIVFPHGLEDLTKSEIETYKGTEIADILK